MVSSISPCLVLFLKGLHLGEPGHLSLIFGPLHSCSRLKCSSGMLSVHAIMEPDPPKPLNPLLLQKKHEMAVAAGGSSPEHAEL